LGIPVSDPTRLLLLAQLVIQIVLIAFVVFLLVLEKRRRVKPDVVDELKVIVSQTQDLSKTLQTDIQQRIEILAKIMADLDAKTRTAEMLIKVLEETALKVKKARQFTQADVQKLHRGGFDPVEIAQITGIPVGEIQLMIKVAGSLS
jgi:DNA-directed RNA polymerase specialized sigma24 family protein